MSKLFFVLKKDLERITKPTMLNFLSIYFFPRGEVYRYTFWLRILQHVKSKKILKIVFGLPVYFIFRHYEFKYGIHANSNMVIGEGLHIVHGDGVYINCKSVGRNFTCYQGVTLGTNVWGGEKPTVLNDVTVYTNSVVIGDILLNDNSVIGANSFVNKNVEENSIVCGNPAKLIKKVEQK